MGLYDDRLAELDEVRSERTSERRSSFRLQESRRTSTDVQSLLFERSEGWTSSKAKSWATSHGYRAGKVDVTDRYIRVPQFDSEGFAVKRTVPFGRGIRAVVAREGRSMAKVVKARRKKKKSASPKRSKRPRRRAKPAAKRTATRRKRRKPAVAKAPRRRKPRRARRAKRAVREVVVAAKRTRKKRRRTTRKVRAWNGQPASHAKAAKKGWRKRKARRASATVTPRKKRRKTAKRRSPKRRKKMSEATSVVMAPRRKKRRKSRKSKRARETSSIVAAPRRRKHRRARASVRTGRRMFAPSNGGRGMTARELATVVFTGTLGFLAADGIDRFLATYNPTAAPPTNKFTSPGAGTLANTLNIAARPNWQRYTAGGLAVVAPALGAAYTRGMTRASLEGFALGAGISFVKTLVQNLVMPLFVGKDNSPADLQKSVIARLYPAEVAASINMKAAQTQVASATSGALSGAPQQLGVGDVGPFALAGDSPYPNVDQALRYAVTGVHDYPTQQNVWGTGNPLAGPGNDYPTASQALRAATGIVGGDEAPWSPAAPPGVGPGPQAGKDCGCVGDDVGNPFLGFVGGESEDSPILINGD